MPWKASSVMEERLRFVAWLEHTASTGRVRSTVGLLTDAGPR
jgi:hypothetical protein